MSEITVPTKNERLIAWVDEIAALTKPASVHWCDGSAEEYDRLCQTLVDGGTFRKLSEAKRPNSYLAWSDPVRRRPRRGPHLHLLRARGGRRPDEQLGGARRDARAARRPVRGRAHAGRTMYVVPFSMGPLGSDKSHVGVQVTDSPYVAVSMRIMTRMGQGALDVARRATASSSRACTRSACRSRTASRTCRGRATTRSTSCTSPRRARSGPTARATAATRCSARSASRCGSPR